MKTEIEKLLLLLFLLAAPGFVSGKNPLTPVTFLKNRGQWQPEILYQATSTSTNVYFLNDGLSFGQSGEEIENPDGTESHPYLVWNMKFVNPGNDLNISGTSERKSVISWLSGNDSSKWVIHPEEYSSLQYQSVFENIDLHFYGVGRDLKYDYIVRRGGDINSIKAFYAGIKGLSVNPSGELEVATDWNIQLQKAPVAWQNVNGKQEPVPIHYKLFNDTTFGFEAPMGYNRNFELVIDPLFQMVWSSYTQATGGSNNINYCFSNAMDRDGNVYLTGMVDGTFPTTPGAYSGPGTVSPEIFVAKFSSDGTTLLYSTYLPGNSSEHGVDLAVDDSGRAYLTGIIELNMTGVTNYPSTANAFQPVHNTGSDAFLTVLNPTGTGLVYSTFLGGTGSETGYGIALGGPGIAYVAGNTSIGNFPTKATSVFPSGDMDVFVAKFDINQSGNNSLVYSTRIGGGSFSYCHGRSIAVNNAGNAFITGSISSSFGTPVYPVTGSAYSSVFNTGQDGVMSFVTKLSATTPVTLEYSTFLAPGTANSIAIDAATDEAIIAGTTYTFAFPVTAGVLQPVHGGSWGTDAFLVRLNSTGSGLVYSTFLGGPFYDTGTGVAVNSAGEAYVTGIAQDSFPTSAGAFQPSNAGTYDFFAVHVNANGTGYGCGGSTYIGGSDADYSGSFYDYSSPHVSLRDHGGNNDTICISSTSHSQDFPTTPGVYGPVKVNGIADQPVFFKMSCFTAALPVAMFLPPGSICPGTCIDFTNLSQNGSSFQWTFQGASVSSSTDMNPAGICYATPGNFTVTLVATNANGSDTITHNITVYPSPPPQGILQSGDTLFANPGAVSYQWYFNGSIVIGATNYFYVAQQSGDYNMIATDANGCEVEAAIYNVTAGLPATPDGYRDESQQLEIFPIPVLEELKIKNEALNAIGVRIEAANVSVYNMPGELVYSGFLRGHDSHRELTVVPITIGGRQLPPGMYILEISSGEKLFRGKFIKE